MKILLILFLSAFAAVAGAQKPPEPMAQPDADYCARRDADPQKCVVQDGPPNPNIIIRKPPPPPPPPVKKATDPK